MIMKQPSPAGSGPSTQIHAQTGTSHLLLSQVGAPLHAGTDQLDRDPHQALLRFPHLHLAVVASDCRGNNADSKEPLPPSPAITPKRVVLLIEAWQPAAVAGQSIHAARIASSWRDQREFTDACAAISRRALTTCGDGQVGPVRAYSI